MKRITTIIIIILFSIILCHPVLSETSMKCTVQDLHFTCVQSEDLNNTARAIVIWTNQTFKDNVTTMISKNHYIQYH